MTREIKFRAWSKGGLYMIPVGELHFTHGGLLIEGPGVHINDPVLMQFSGLKDKNGKEIYEGDLFPSAKGYWEVKEGAWQFWDGEKLVRMYGWYAECLMIEGDHSHSQLPLRPLEIEVIGNIYENPEIIK